MNRGFPGDGTGDEGRLQHGDRLHGVVRLAGLIGPLADASAPVGGDALCAVEPKHEPGKIAHVERARINSRVRAALHGQSRVDVGRRVRSGNGDRTASAASENEDARSEREPVGPTHD